MKWAIKEDYMVCNFYLSHIDNWKEFIDELMAQLYENNFNERDKGSVIMRIQNYSYLRTQCGLSNVAKQSYNIYNVLIGKSNNLNNTNALQTYIKQNFIKIDSIDFTKTEKLPDSFVITKPLGPKFSDVLFNFIDKHGLKDSEVYNACCLSRQTFSDIRNNKTKVSKKTVMQLCFGVKLSYEESNELMKSAGYAFSNNNLLDVIVEWHLKEKIYDTYAVDVALCDYNQNTLFSIS